MGICWAAIPADRSRVSPGKVSGSRTVTSAAVMKPGKDVVDGNAVVAQRGGRALGQGALAAFAYRVGDPYRVAGPAASFCVVHYPAQPRSRMPGMNALARYQEASSLWCR
jgi:hypothetical protein